MLILVLHCPNLNLLRVREPAIYARATLEDIDRRLSEVAEANGVALTTLQSNHEGVLIDQVQDARGVFDGLLINPGGLTHSSVSLRDALASAPPTVVVHLTNIHAREPFRHQDLMAPVCVGGVYGLGADVYELGLLGLIRWLQREGQGDRAPASAS
jgi:3-dehydroquinate dehydratase-2